MVTAVITDMVTAVITDMVTRSRLAFRSSCKSYICISKTGDHLVT